MTNFYTFSGRGVAWHGAAGHGGAGQGGARQGKYERIGRSTGANFSRHGMARLGDAWRGRARLGTAWLGKARKGEATTSASGGQQMHILRARLGSARPGGARRGWARRGEAGQGKYETRGR